MANLGSVIVTVAIMILLADKGLKDLYLRKVKQVKT